MRRIAQLVALCSLVACGSVKALVDGGTIDGAAGDAPAQVSLTITRSGTGSGAVTSSPAGIDCGTSCSMTVARGTQVTLTATPDSSSDFAAWSGAGCSGTGTCVVTVTADTTIDAQFVAKQVTLTIVPNGNGTGRTTSSPEGIDCGSTCSARFDVGTVVALTAAADTSSTFVGWVGGGCSGTGTCRVTLTADTTIQPGFALKNSLVVARDGTGTGSVTSTPPGIDCGTSCSAQFPPGTSVTLTEEPGPQSVFAGWSGGGCAGTGTTCTVTVNAAMQVTATFNLKKYAVTVVLAGAGTGSVSSTPGGISCGSACSASFDYGTSVSLTATPTGGSTFAGWSGGGCTGTGSCNITITGATTITATFDAAAAPNIVFVTSTTHTGNLGGLSGADAICAARAQAAGLSGNFVAYLSTSTVDAISRLGTAEGWVRPDGKPVFDTTADLLDGRIFYPPRLDELGTDVGQVLAFTATYVDGKLFPGDSACGNWTGTSGTTTIGYSSGGSYTFFDFGSVGCSAEEHFYCFQIDRKSKVTPPQATGRYAFVTQGFFTPGGGLAAADAMCANEAAAAGLAGTYLAAVATTTASAASRFNAAAAPWVRTDGPALAPTASGLFNLAFLDVADNVNAAGDTSYANYGVWNGATSWTSVGTAASTCNNWTSNLSTSTGSGGRTGDTKSSILFGAFDPADPCDATYIKLLCLQT